MENQEKQNQNRSFEKKEGYNTFIPNPDTELRKIMEEEGFIFLEKGVGLFGLCVENYLPSGWGIYEFNDTRNNPVIFVTDQNSNIRYRAGYQRISLMDPDPVIGKTIIKSTYSAELTIKNGPKLQDHALYIYLRKLI